MVIGFARIRLRCSDSDERKDAKNATSAKRARNVSELRATASPIPCSLCGLILAVFASFAFTRTFGHGAATYVETILITMLHSIVSRVSVEDDSSGRNNFITPEVIQLMEAIRKHASTINANCTAKAMCIHARSHRPPVVAETR